MYLRRKCYDKFWRCPGWAGGGWKYPLVKRCAGGSLLVPGSWNRAGTEALPEDRWWKWKTHRCRKCDVVTLPFVTKYVDLTYWWEIFSTWARWTWWDIKYWWRHRRNRNR